MKDEAAENLQAEKEKALASEQAKEKAVASEQAVRNEEPSLL